MGLCSLRSSPYALAEMIENWDENGGVGSKRIDEEEEWR